MIVRRIAAGTTLVAACLFIAAPVAQADTGAGAGSSQIDIGCLLQSLSGTPATADCDPPSIPTP
ncbi:hypothetical protein [Nocardia sp. A7]|uniref:hypothetical protein n=1 Tax=Nocardia sp. A7 TaxID=2789274 RepID=UPI00397A8934